MLQSFGLNLVNGNGMNVDLLMDKICTDVLVFGKEVCENLEAGQPEFDEVQKWYNDFISTMAWVAMGPGLIMSLISGALSDDFGRKPLIIVPMIGFLLSGIFEIIFYTFEHQLPIYFWYLTLTFQFMGGMGVYYLGYYGFGATVASADKRAMQLARFDGAERVGSLLGSLVSNVVYESLGSYGNYFIRTGCTSFYLLWLIFYIKEPVAVKETKKIEDHRTLGQKIGTTFTRYIITPLKDMGSALVRSRPGRLRVLLYVSLSVYALYASLFPMYELLYVYGIKAVPGFDNGTYAMYNAFADLCNIITLLFVLPVVMPRIKAHESLVLTGITFLSATSHLLTAYAANFIQFLLVQGLLQCFSLSMYSFIRSLTVRCIDSEHEIGKVLSVLALSATIMPTVSGYLLRLLYNATISTFPGSIYLTSSSTYVVCTLLNFFIYTQRKQFRLNKNCK